MLTNIYEKIDGVVRLLRETSQNNELTRYFDIGFGAILGLLAGVLLFWLQNRRD